MTNDISDGGMYHIVPYGSYTAYTPALPQFYWDVYSSEQRIKHICYEIDKIINYADSLGVQLNVTHDDVAKLQEDFEKFKESGFNEYYEKQIEQWMQDNATTLFEELAKMVFFGLTDDGRFCAFVPQSWNDIVFDTGMVYGTEEYGRLILRFDATGTNIVNNTADNISLSSLVSTVGSLSTNVDKLNVTAYTPITKEE